ncbi:MULTISPECIES: glycosyltransferase [Robiginitalea]|nr:MULTISPECIES: glycosyltransferase [Robiginitalea]MDC6355539.1 glycosyltransferase [Robiginitalea sp. PM2]MDC6375851.1 glycosyltransferase [Robiginitalea sp. SP8]
MATENSKRLVIIMPAHNEGKYLRACLESFASQERQPDELLIVDDNSTDRTAQIAGEFARAHDWIRLAGRTSGSGHQPGPKVVECFEYGLSQTEQPYDFIGKFDADILLPPDYFRKVLEAFEAHPGLGLCGGHLYVERNGKTVYEPIAGPGHVRGPVKLYSKACFRTIGGLRPSIGWDMADALLARYHGFGVRTLPELKVIHMRPTGFAYSARNARLQGQALYQLRYGVGISLLSSLKMAWKRRNPLLPFQHLSGYLRAFFSGSGRLLTRQEGAFARNWRWREIRRKLS